MLFIPGRKRTHRTPVTLLEGQPTLCAKQLSTREEGDARNCSLKSQTTAMEIRSTILFACLLPNN